MAFGIRRRREMIAEAVEDAVERLMLARTARYVADGLLAQDPYDADLYRRQRDLAHVLGGAKKPGRA